MSLIDLRTRVDEARITSLVELSHGSRESAESALAQYRSGSYFLLGWEEDDDVVGIVGLQRAGTDLVIRSLAVAPEHRRRGVGRALIEALAVAATDTDQLVAETDDDSVGFYERCGFVIEEAPEKDDRVRYHCTQGIEPRAVSAEAVAAITLTDLERAVRAAWSRETADPANDWQETNPAAGHCDVTALIVRELLGGEILIAGVVRDGRRVERHAWNRLPSGLTVDLTREQFLAGETLEEPRVSEPIVALRNGRRYELFAERVRSALEQFKTI